MHNPRMPDQVDSRRLTVRPALRNSQAPVSSQNAEVTTGKRNDSTARYRGKVQDKMLIGAVASPVERPPPEVPIHRDAPHRPIRGPPC